jgi:GNAT superfamily N-acetyltransferase
MSYIGIAPDRQGNGLGTALLRRCLTAATPKARRPTWKATKERNLSLCRRLGLEVREAMLHLVSPRHAEEATLTGSQIAKASSSNATANRRFTGSSTASS